MGNLTRRDGSTSLYLHRRGKRLAAVIDAEDLDQVARVVEALNKQGISVAKTVTEVGSSTLERWVAGISWAHERGGSRRPGTAMS